MTAATSAQLGVLTYASLAVHTSPPRTVLRMAFAAAGWVCRALLAGLGLCIVALGYAVLGAVAR